MLRLRSAALSATGGLDLDWQRKLLAGRDDLSPGWDLLSGMDLVRLYYEGQTRRTVQSLQDSEYAKELLYDLALDCVTGLVQRDLDNHVNGGQDGFSCGLGKAFFIGIDDIQMLAKNVPSVPEKLLEEYIQAGTFAGIDVNGTWPVLVRVGDELAPHITLHVSVNVILCTTGNTKLVLENKDTGKALLLREARLGALVGLSHAIEVDGKLTHPRALAKRVLAGQFKPSGAKAMTAMGMNASMRSRADQLMCFFPVEWFTPLSLECIAQQFLIFCTALGEAYEKAVRESTTRRHARNTLSKVRLQVEPIAMELLDPTSAMSLIPMDLLGSLSERTMSDRYQLLVESASRLFAHIIAHGNLGVKYFLLRSFSFSEDCPAGEGNIVHIQKDPTTTAILAAQMTPLASRLGRRSSGDGGGSSASKRKLDNSPARLTVSSVTGFDYTKHGAKTAIFDLRCANAFGGTVISDHEVHQSCFGAFVAAATACSPALGQAAANLSPRASHAVCLNLRSSNAGRKSLKVSWLIELADPDELPRPHWALVLARLSYQFMPLDPQFSPCLPGLVFVEEEAGKDDGGARRLRSDMCGRMLFTSPEALYFGDDPGEGMSPWICMRPEPGDDPCCCERFTYGLDECSGNVTGTLLSALACGELPAAFKQAEEYYAAEFKGSRGTPLQRRKNAVVALMKRSVGRSVFGTHRAATGSWSLLCDSVERVSNLLLNDGTAINARWFDVHAKAAIDMDEE